MKSRKANSALESSNKIINLGTSSDRRLWQSHYYTAKQYTARASNIESKRSKVASSLRVPAAALLALLACVKVISRYTKTHTILMSSQLKKRCKITRYCGKI